MKPQEFIPEAIKVGGPSANTQEWIDKIYKEFPNWPLDHNQRVMVWGEQDDPNQQFAVFELVPSMSKKNAVEVKWFQAYPLRQGVGSKAMRELQSLAAKDGISLTLFPWDKGQVSQAALTKFYKKSGFKPMQKGGKVMAWSPEELDEDALDEWSTTDDDIISALKRKGYQFLGSGVDQTAFSEPDTGLVLKIFGTQQGTGQFGDKIVFSNDQKMFFKWAEFCMKNKNNPFLPKFYGFESFIFNGQTYLQIRQERLKSIGELGWRISHMTDRIDSVDISSSTKKDAIETIKTSASVSFSELSNGIGQDKVVKLLATVFDLYKIAQKNGYRWDLHGANYMMRDDGTPVIVDPWVVSKQSARPTV